MVRDASQENFIYVIFYRPIFTSIFFFTAEFFFVFEEENLFFVNIYLYLYITSKYVIFHSYP